MLPVFAKWEGETEGEKNKIKIKGKKVTLSESGCGAEWYRFVSYRGNWRRGIRISVIGYQDPRPGSNPNRTLNGIKMIDDEIEK